MKKRNFGLDLIRVIAVFFVISVHFFQNTDFYTLPIKGKLPFILIFFRWLFFISVPLFLLLTGYLQSNKKLEKKYYKGIIRILISYFFISIIALLFRFCYLGQRGSRLEAIINIFSFKTIPISWYIEMYIGLFLLIPFLNVLYKGIRSKKGKQWLILTLLIITSLSPVINFLKIKGFYLEIVPNWWNTIYPLTYYFIGCYIKQYQITISKCKGVFLLLGMTLLETIASYLYCFQNTFSWDFLGGVNSIATVIIATTLFLLFYQIKTNKQILTKIITFLSEISLDIYLFSWISDVLIYQNFTTIRQEYLYAPIYILSSFLLASLFATIKRLLFTLLNKIISFLKPKYKKGISN